MLTQQDIAEIEKLLKDALDKKIKLLPTKEEFFKKMDKLMGEVKAMRESQELHAGQHARLDDLLDSYQKRIKALEHSVPATP